MLYLLHLESVTDCGRGSIGKRERFIYNKKTIKYKCPIISWKWATGTWMKGWFFSVWQDTGRQKIAQQLGKYKPKTHGEIMEQEGHCFL